MAILDGDAKMELSYIIVATTVVILTKCRASYSATAKILGTHGLTSRLLCHCELHLHAKSENAYGPGTPNFIATPNNC